MAGAAATEEGCTGETEVSLRGQSSSQAPMFSQIRKKLIIGEVLVEKMNWHRSAVKDYEWCHLLVPGEPMMSDLHS